MLHTCTTTLHVGQPLPPALFLERNAAVEVPTSDPVCEHLRPPVVRWGLQDPPGGFCCSGVPGGAGEGSPLEDGCSVLGPLFPFPFSKATVVECAGASG